MIAREEVGLGIQILNPESVAHLEMAKESDTQVRKCLLDLIRISSFHLCGGIDSRIPKNTMFQFLVGNGVTFVYTWPGFRVCSVGRYQWS